MGVWSGSLGEVSIVQGGNPATVVAPAITLDETLVAHLKTLAALYGFDATDLRRVVVDTTGRIRTAPREGSVALIDGYSNTPAVVEGDAGGLLRHLVSSVLFNETTHDRIRGNTERVAAASAARTVTGNSGVLTNYNARGVLGILDVTAVSGTGPTLDVALLADDPASTQQPVLASGADSVAFAQNSAVATVQIHVHPSLTKITATNANQFPAVLPRSYLWRWTIGGTTPSYTFSIGEALQV